MLAETDQRLLAMIARPMPTMVRVYREAPWTAAPTFGDAFEAMDACPIERALRPLVENGDICVIYGP